MGSLGRACVAAGLFLLLGLGAKAAQPVASESDVLDLPAPLTAGTLPLEGALHQRRSVRRFAPRPLSLAEASQLLWAGQGITRADGGRTAPSAGALYPLELYLICGEVQGLAAGVYRYRPQGPGLQPIAQGDRRAALATAALHQPWLREAAALILVAAVPERAVSKYGQRGIRYAYLEAGHAAQNILLQVTALGLGAVAVGAFDDDAVQRIVGLPPAEQPLYLLPLGKPATGR